MIDAEFVNAIKDLAQQAGYPNHSHPPEEPASVYYHNGERVVAAPKHRSHKAGDIPSLCDMAADQDTTTPEFWFNRSGITLFLDGSQRWDTVRLDLSASPQLAKLQAWESGRTSLSQTELILTLRTLFPYALLGIDLVNLVRRVRTTVTTSAEQKRTGASYGKEIAAQINDQTSIPDYVEFEVPIFSAGSMDHYRGKVTAAFEYDAEKQLFQLIPVAGQIEAAFAAAESRMGSEINEAMSDRDIEAENFGLYYGQA